VGMLIYSIYLVTSIAISVLLTWAVRNVANHLNLAFAPVSSRHVHTRPIPRLGGVAVFFTFALVVAIFYVAGKLGFNQPPVSEKLIKVVLASLPIFAAGIWDDLRGLSPRAKLLVQIASGAGLYFAGLRLFSVEWQFAGVVLSSAICLAATIGWVVLVCNAINLIDGLDGLAAGAALFSMVTIFTVAFVAGRFGVTMGTTILAGAVLGFLVFNMNPASIFLGDCGSLFVGFMLSTFVLAEAPKQPDAVNTFFVPFISFALPLTDTVLSVLRRFLSGRKLFHADREHIHHKLLELGLTQRQVVFVLYGASAVFALMSIFLLYGSHVLLIPVMAALGLFVFFSVRRLGYPEFEEFTRVGKRARQQKRMFARNVAVRKAAAQIQRAAELDQLIENMEACLAGDFDGFEIVLARGFMGHEHALGRAGAGAGAIRHFWNDISNEKITLVLEISTAGSGKIGQLSLHRKIGGELLIDTGLLANDLRRSLAMGLEKCLKHSAAAYATARNQQATLAEFQSGD
jgi:UDP-GlcNAc:undecaprenyl-phosphate/decaprenyl-phosphate GlcNAc-1-phosphate transferase